MISTEIKLLYFGEFLHHKNDVPNLNDVTVVMQTAVVVPTIYLILHVIITIITYNVVSYLYVREYRATMGRIPIGSHQWVGANGNLPHSDPKGHI